MPRGSVLHEFTRRKTGVFTYGVPYFRVETLSTTRSDMLKAARWTALFKCCVYRYLQPTPTGEHPAFSNDRRTSQSILHPHLR